jgi:hypothetical protein
MLTMKAIAQYIQKRTSRALVSQGPVEGPPYTLVQFKIRATETQYAPKKRDSMGWCSE